MIDGKGRSTMKGMRSRKKNNEFNTSYSQIVAAIQLPTSLIKTNEYEKRIAFRLRMMAYFKKHFEIFNFFKTFQSLFNRKATSRKSTNRKALNRKAKLAADQFEKYEEYLREIANEKSSVYDSLLNMDLDSVHRHFENITALIQQAQTEGSSYLSQYEQHLIEIKASTIEALKELACNQYLLAAEGEKPAIEKYKDQIIEKIITEYFSEEEKSLVHRYLSNQDNFKGISSQFVKLRDELNKIKEKKIIGLALGSEKFHLLFGGLNKHHKAIIISLIADILQERSNDSWLIAQLSNLKKYITDEQLDINTWNEQQAAIEQYYKKDKLQACLSGYFSAINKDTIPLNRSKQKLNITSLLQRIQQLGLLHACSEDKRVQTALAHIQKKAEYQDFANLIELFLENGDENLLHMITVLEEQILAYVEIKHSLKSMKKALQKPEAAVNLRDLAVFSEEAFIAAGLGSHVCEHDLSPSSVRIRAARISSLLSSLVRNAGKNQEIDQSIESMLAWNDVKSYKHMQSLKSQIDAFNLRWNSFSENPWGYVGQPLFTPQQIQDLLQSQPDFNLNTASLDKWLEELSQASPMAQANFIAAIEALTQYHPNYQERYSTIIKPLKNDLVMNAKEALRNILKDGRDLSQLSDILHQLGILASKEELATFIESLKNDEQVLGNALTKVGSYYLVKLLINRLNGSFLQESILAGCQEALSRSLNLDSREMCVFEKDINAVIAGNNDVVSAISKLQSYYLMLLAYGSSARANEVHVLLQDKFNAYVDSQKSVSEIHKKGRNFNLLFILLMLRWGSEEHVRVLLEDETLRKYYEANSSQTLSTVFEKRAALSNLPAISSTTKEEIDVSALLNQAFGFFSPVQTANLEQAYQKLSTSTALNAFSSLFNTPTASGSEFNSSPVSGTEFDLPFLNNEDVSHSLNQPSAAA